MQSRQANMLQSLRAVDAFLTAHADTLGDVVNSGTRKRLAKTISSLETTVADQAGSSVVARGGTQRYRALRQTLIRDHMAPIARMARADLPPTPEVDALRMPRPNWSAERLAAAAHGMAEAATPFAPELVAAGLRSDFIDRLTAAADAMVQALSDRAQNRGRLSGATKGLATTLVSARRLVGVIDALVTSTLVDDPALLAHWNGVKRVRRVPQSDAAAPPVVLPLDARVPGTALPAPARAGAVGGD